MRQLLMLFSVVMLVLVMGCKPEEEAPKDNEGEPPPPTADEIYAGELKPIYDRLYGPLQGRAIGKSGLVELPQQMRALKQKHDLTENGPEALSMLSRNIEDLIPMMRNEDRWFAVKSCIVTWKAMHPDARKYDRLEETADLYLAIPHIYVKGVFGPEDDQAVLVELKDPRDEKFYEYRVRVGDEFHEVLRLVRIIGDNSEFEFLYKPLEIIRKIGGPNAR